MSTTLGVEIEQIGPTTSRVLARSHTVFVDRPIARGGADKGPVGGEYMLIGLGGCFMSHLLGAIRSREADITDAKVTVSGILDGSPERFTQLTVTVAATGDAELLEKLAVIAQRGCQVMNTLKDAVPIVLAVQPSTIPSR